MSRALTAARSGVGIAALVGSLITGGLIIAPTATAATTTYTVRTSVNVRSAPNTTGTIYTQFQGGEVVKAAGKATGKWLPISYDGKTAFVWASYLKKDSTAATIVTSGPAGRRTALNNTTVRSSANSNSNRMSTIKKGATASVTGLSSGDFAQVSINSTTGWVDTDDLSTPTDTTPAPVANYTTTLKLALRSYSALSSSNLGKISTGTQVAGTGVSDGPYSQVSYDGKSGWVYSGYLKAKSGTAKQYILPSATGLLYLQRTAWVRSKPTSDSKIEQVEASTRVGVTGVTKSDYTQIIWDGELRWVPTSTVGVKKPAIVDLGTPSLNKLEPLGKAAVLLVRANFPEIKTIGGWRAGSAYSSDHPNGRAIDVMIPSYKSNKALGDKIAQYFVDNGDKLGVTYIIWRQRIYTMKRGAWKKMANRGSDNQNHMNHVHVSFKPS